IELVSAGTATTLGLLGVFCGAHAGIISSQAARYGFSALVSVLAAVALVGVVYTVRYGYEQLAAWLLIMVVAARVIVETTATAPQAFLLLWPLYVVPILTAHVVLGARAGLLTVLGAPVMFVFNYFALSDTVELTRGFEVAVIANLGLYLGAIALVHVALARVSSAVREVKQVAGSHERARTELREREMQFSALAESSPTGIVIQQDGRLVYGNPYFFEMAGCLSSDGFGFSLWDFFDSAGVSELKAQLKRRQALSGAVGPSLLVFKPLKGRTRWCEVAVAEAMFWQNPAVVANVLDVTERVQAQLAVQRERDFSNNIINTAEAIIMATNADGQVTLFNPAGTRITGYEAAELQGRPYWEVLAPPEQREEAAAVFALVREEMRGNAEVTWATKTGEDVTISWHFVAQRNTAGAFTGFVGVGIDVTQQRLLERQAMVTERLRSLGQIAGGVAHDLNNMLAGIIGPADLLLMVETDGERQRSLNAILAAATRGAETVRRIQSFSKARTDLDKQVFDLRELTEDVIFSLRPRWRDVAQRQGITITIHDEVPRGLLVHASAGEVGNVLMNLIVNACEAMGANGTITIRGAQRADTVEFQVQDTGSGMSPETMAHIFQPFFSTKGADNSGLGLAVIHGIILRHGGTIAADSELGVGTTFTITLPASVPDEDAPETATPDPTRASERLRLLVVDDMPDIADYIAAVARHAGHEVATEHGGEEALQRLQEQPFDAVITDYGMAGISGTQLADKARRLQPGIQIVLVTGWDVAPGEIEGLAGLLHKPCTREQVEAALRKLAAPNNS
ncbi:MAG: PAS domain S-box protein, partial [Armatimonadetes bacterium]|nr:PAS domain S-box protein [Armatimonadota bacterium]